MPVKYVCSNCGYVLWDFRRVGQDYYGVPTPEEVIRVVGVCPRCKKELKLPTMDEIVIRPLRKPLPLSLVKEEISKPSVLELSLVKHEEFMSAQEA